MIYLIMSLFFDYKDKTIVELPPHFEEEISAPKMEFDCKNNICISLVVNTESLIVANLDGKIIYSKNPDRILPIASLTKIMTALLAIENYNINDALIIPNEATKVKGVKMWLLPNEQISFEAILNGMLISSANDAALASAILISGDEKKFVNLMNKKAKELKLTDTYFVNSTGLDSPLGSNVSSSRDLLKLSTFALKNDLFSSIISKKKATFYSTSKKTRHVLTTTNQHLGKGGIIGLKTGFTDRAGECLILLTEDDKILIILNSADRFSESKEILKILNLWKERKN